jgi:[acyl-carrier-protein] S-malonyltransferase
VLAGHRLGEYSAWVASGALEFRAALPLVRLRAQAMQDAVPVGTGAMAAVLGLDDDAVRAVCEEAGQGEVVEAVNYNAPQQVVIAGHRSAVERAAGIAKAKGAKRALLLPVSAPFHSSLLAPAAQRLAQALAQIDFAPPRIPVVNNVDVACVTEPDAIRSALARQACKPVLWVDSVRHIAALPVARILECGPGRVLAGLVRRIVPQVESLALTDSSALVKACEVPAHG